MCHMNGTCVSLEYSLTILSRINFNTLFILISSIISQKRSTTSCMLFSQTPLKIEQMNIIMANWNNITAEFSWIMAHYYCYCYCYDYWFMCQKYLVAEALNARRAVRQNVWRFNGKAGFIDAHTTASFARVLNYIAHAALQSLRFTVWNTFSVAALTSLLAGGTINHWRWLWTFRLPTRTSCFLFTSGILSFTAFYASRHILAILATWWIFITTHRPLITT